MASLRPFDLAKEPGCRFWYEESESGSRLLWQVHHAVTDGVGMRPVVIDILLHYAMATSGESVERYSRELYCSRFKAAELLRRSDFSHLPKSKRSISTWQRIKNAKYFHFMRPRTLLGSGAQSASSVEDRRVLCLASLDAELSERVFAKCSASSVAIHELAMALLFRTCAEWNRSCGDRNPKSHIRLMMPVDLRDRRDLPDASCESFEFHVLW